MWTDSTLVRWDRGAPEIYDMTDRAQGNDGQYDPVSDPAFCYMGTSARSFTDVVHRGVEHEGDLIVAACDLSLEVAIAAKHSALRGNVPVPLPLADRSLSLYPRAYRWLWGDQLGEPQSIEDARLSRQDST